MKALFAILLAILCVTQSEPDVYTLEMRVFVSVKALDFDQLLIHKDDAQHLLYALPDIRLPLGKKTRLKLVRSQFLSPKPNENTSELCEFLLARKADGSFDLKCEWLITEKKPDGTITTEFRPYSRSLKLEEWAFTTYAQPDALDRYRYLGFFLDR